MQTRVNMIAYVMALDVTLQLCLSCWKTLHWCSTQAAGKYELKKSSKYLSHQPSVDVILGNILKILDLDIKSNKSLLHLLYYSVLKTQVPSSPGDDVSTVVTQFHPFFQGDNGKDKKWTLNRLEIMKWHIQIWKKYSELYVDIFQTKICHNVLIHG